MMAKWTKILPFFVVEWWARKNCERFLALKGDRTGVYVSPYKDCMLILKR